MRLFLKALKNKLSLPSRLNEIKVLKEKGYPTYLEGPLKYLATGKLVDDEDKEIEERVESLRRAMLLKKQSIPIFYSPKPKSAGEVATPEMRPEHGEVKDYSMEEIANRASIAPYWGKFLYLISKASEAKTVIEFGACAGISGSYLAAAPSVKRFITIEASKELAAIAEANIKQLNPKAEVYNELFDDALDHLLPGLKESGIDLAWIDGHHEKIATIHYFQRIKPYLNKGAVVLFDDISWSADMREAWDELSQTKGFSFTLDLKTAKGLCIWSGDETVSPQVAFFDRPKGEITINKPVGW